METLYSQSNGDTIYDHEQRLFAEMQRQNRNCKRRKRRRRALMWVLRRL